MHRKFAKDGLVCLSISVDESAGQPRALAFLKRQEATFPNYWLDETGQFWQDKWDIGGPPAVFVFDRNNQRAAKYDGDHPDKPLDYDEVEKLVLELLKERKQD